MKIDHNELVVTNPDYVIQNNYNKTFIGFYGMRSDSRPVEKLASDFTVAVIKLKKWK